MEPASCQTAAGAHLSQHRRIDYSSDATDATWYCWCFCIEKDAFSSIPASHVLRPEFFSPLLLAKITHCAVLGFSIDRELVVI